MLRSARRVLHCARLSPRLLKMSTASGLKRKASTSPLDGEPASKHAKLAEPQSRAESKHAVYPHVDNPPLKFEVHARWNKARVGKLTLPHGVVDTPVFMPVGTQGTIKGLTSAQVDSLGCQIILGNTYHLGVRPGTDLIDDLGGLHKFMNWKRNLLTDSGGFQMVSLFDLAEITEEGVSFQSPVDGSQLLLTPEKSIHYQNQIGADIMMALDDVCSSLTVGPRVEEAMHRTLRWIDRCIGAHKRPKDQNLFGIVQGGLDAKLRDYCLREMVKRRLPGYAIGGLAGGEDKAQFWRVVHQSTGPTCKITAPAALLTELKSGSKPDSKSAAAASARAEAQITTFAEVHALVSELRAARRLEGDAAAAVALRSEAAATEAAGSAGGTEAAGLPDSKPRYLMGVGYPVDLVVCVALGVDMFDCVWPCRTARFGTAIVPSGLLQLKKSQFAGDQRPIDPDCRCPTCAQYSRAFLHSIVAKEELACHLVTVHNIAHMMALMRGMREAIREGRFPDHVRAFMLRQFPKKNYPLWVVEALQAAGIELDGGDAVIAAAAAAAKGGAGAAGAGAGAGAGSAQRTKMQTDDDDEA